MKTLFVPLTFSITWIFFRFRQLFLKTLHSYVHTICKIICERRKITHTYNHGCLNLFPPQTPNAEIEYAIDAQDEVANKFFYISESSGDIFIAQSLQNDPEERELYEVGRDCIFTYKTTLVISLIGITSLFAIRFMSRLEHSPCLFTSHKISGSLQNEKPYHKESSS